MPSLRLSFKQALFAAAALAASGNALVSMPAHAAHPLQSELETMFGSMSNFTGPDAFESARRGVLAGGGLTVRNRTYDLQLAAFVPPSAKGSCAGIDIFLGSFSYISLDQFLNFLRSIASHAAGYAFQMALSASCDLCVKIMEAMRKAAQAMNNLNMNSCQMAQGIVSGSPAALDQLTNSVATLGSIFSGDSDDLVDAQTNSKTPIQQVQESSQPESKRALEEIAGGNIIWNALTKSAVNDWFGLAATETAMKEALMSITGTIVVVPDQGPDGNMSTARDDYPAVLKLRDLIEGTNRSGAEKPHTQDQSKLYSCDADRTECLKPRATAATDLKGLAPVIYEALTKDGGIIDKFARYTPGASFTDQEKSIIAGLPAGIGMMVRNLSLASAETARSLAWRISRVAALSMAYSLSRDLIDASEKAMQLAPNVSKIRARELFPRAREAIDREAALLQAEYGSPAELLAMGSEYLRYAQFPLPSGAFAPAPRTASSSR